jgi:hypothetical protein
MREIDTIGPTLNTNHPLVSISLIKRQEMEQSPSPNFRINNTDTN